MIRTTQADPAVLLYLRQKHGLDASTFFCALAARPTTAYPQAHRLLRAIYQARAGWWGLQHRAHDAQVRQQFYLDDHQRRIEQSTQALLFRCALDGQFLRRLRATLRTLYHI